MLGLHLALHIDTGGSSPPRHQRWLTHNYILLAQHLTLSSSKNAFCVCADSVKSQQACDDLPEEQLRACAVWCC